MYRLTHYFWSNETDESDESEYLCEGQGKHMDDDAHLNEVEGQPKQDDAYLHEGQGQPEQDKAYLNEGQVQRKRDDPHLNEGQGQPKPDNIQLQNDISPPNETEGKKTDLIDYMGLRSYYESKLSLEDVMAIQNDTEYQDKQDISRNTIAQTILRKLIMTDYRAYTSEVNKLSQANSTTADECIWDELDEEDSIFNNLDFLKHTLSNLDFLKKPTEEFNAQDIFLVIFACSDLRLRQILLKKMQLCRLAFPVFSPGVDNESIMFNMWAMRNTVLCWRDKDKKVMEYSSTKHPIHIASCIRLNRPDLSKSKYLNNIICDQYHNTFYNGDCANGKVKRVVSDGLVEGSHFLPNGEEKETLKDPILFLNLRGDGLQLEKQVDVLCAISHVMIVCVDISHVIESKTIIAVNKICTTSKEVILVLSDRKRSDKKTIKVELSNFKKAVKNAECSIQIVVAFSDIDQTQLKVQSRAAIAKAINGKIGTVLEESSNHMKRKGVCIDEEDSTCQMGIHLGNATLAYLGVRKCKTEELLLQGKHWAEWCKHLKSSKRSQAIDLNSAVKRSVKIESEMNYHKTEQAKLCSNLSPFIKNFITTLAMLIDKPEVDYYLQWLKMYFDDKVRENVSLLRIRYNTKLKMSNDMKNTLSESETKQLLGIKEELEDTSWGIEHVMREMAQIYEASIQGDESMESFIRNLPLLVAKLILRGQAFEILDGDASGIPMSWLKAVFTELEKLTGNKKVYCLSVLGIQSSGKSTLLNTMFGLQCPVSAGTCTRGVFMQLLKVAETENYPFDYIAVIDSEGLRAVELGDSKVDHDNELATFVIGLSNLTLINIKGENIADIKDILQIVAHAFLRMGLVETTKRNDRSCIFLHQNVSAVNAAELMAEAAHKLETALDEKTREAAELENIVGIQSFNEIIRFNNENVWSFPDLWTGNPPMGVVNTGYQEKVMKIKADIINVYAKNSKSIISFHNLKDQILAMWNAVLSDDFVFGFRNATVTKAYTRLETKFSELKWEMHQVVLDWTTSIQWERYNTQEKLVNASHELKDEVRKLVHEKSDNIRSKLVNFIDNDSEKEIMESWKSDKLRVLDNITETQVIEAENTIENKKQEQVVRLVQTVNQEHNKADILKRAEQLAQNLKGNALDERHLESEFQKMWDEWFTKDCRKDVSTTPEDISMILTKALNDRFKNHGHKIRESLSDKRTLARLPSEKLNGTFSAIDINDEWLNVKKPIQVWKWNEYQLQAKADIAESVNHMFSHIDLELFRYRVQQLGFQNHYPNEIFKILITDLTSFDGKSKRYSLKIDFHVMVALHVYTYLQQYFQMEQAMYLQDWSPAAKLEAYKQTSYKHFMNIATEKNHQIIFLDRLGDELEHVVKESVQKSIQVTVVKEIVPHFMNKRKLIRAMLIDLAYKESYSDYDNYIKRSAMFVPQWIHKYTNEYIFKKGKTSTWYIENIEVILQDLSKRLKKAGQEASEASHQKTSEFWVLQLIKEMSKITYLSKTHLQHPGQYIIKDTGKLTELVIECIDKVMEKIFLYFTSHEPKWTDPSPYSQIVDALWGCEAVCHFCNEPCIKDKHDPVVDQHECLQHRPGAVAKSSYRETRILQNANCDFLVQSTVGFYCGGSFSCICAAEHQSEEVHWYKDIRHHVPSWKILPSSNMDTCTYWRWFVNKFQADLVMGTDLIADFPKSWNDITKNAAMKSLSFYE